MAVVLGVALGLIICGLLMAYLSSSMKFPLLVTLVYWAGVVCVLFGLVLLVTPILVWVSGQIRAMIEH